jgi:hypothetical protein
MCSSFTWLADVEVFFCYIPRPQVLDRWYLRLAVVAQICSRTSYTIGAFCLAEDNLGVLRTLRSCGTAFESRILDRLVQN